MIYPQVTSRKAAHHFCRFCMHGFTREELLEAHEGECNVHSEQKVVFPEKPMVQFKAIEKQFPIPFVVYADFESVLEPVDILTAQTTKFQHHRAYSYMYTIVSTLPNVEMESRLYVGTDTVTHFLKTLDEDLKKMNGIIKHLNVPMVFDEAARLAFEAAVDCRLCGLPLNGDRVRDHCHYTGAFRSAVHNQCNIRYGARHFKLPVVMHNLSGYDAHLIMQQLGEGCGRLSVIPTNFEKYLVN